MKAHLTVLAIIGFLVAQESQAGGWDYLWGKWEQKHTKEVTVVLTPTNIVISTSTTQELWKVTSGTGIVTGLKVQRGDQKLEAKGSVKFNEMIFSLGERRWLLRKAGSKNIVFPPGETPNQPPNLPDGDPRTILCTTKLPDEVQAQQLKDMNWGMFICWSFSTFYGHEWTPTLDKDASYFKATGCDTDQWCKTAKGAGMGYILFLAKHHDGFCLWDTKTTDKKVTNSPLGIDVLAKLKKSCDKYVIKLALYFSEGDWNWPGAADGKGHWVASGKDPEMKKAQLKELLTQYGPIEFWWMDHAAGTGGLSHKETVEFMHRFQPNTFVGFNHGQKAGRIALREVGKPGPLGDPKAASPHNRGGETGHNFQLAEFTYPILPKHKGGAMWFYSLPKHENLCHPASKLFKDYQGAQKYGNIFSIDVGPNYAGKIRDIDIKTLKQVGAMIQSENTQQENSPDKK